MTFHTPSHRKRALLFDTIHFFHITVTGFTRHAFCNVPLMRKIDVIRELVDPDPLNGFTGVIGCSHLLNQRTVGLHHIMTVHTDIERRNCCVSRFLYSRVAVLAGNLSDSGVKLMTERNGLLWSIALIRCSRIKLNESYG
ncbi:unnamed protein product [Sphagnum tenellum]